MSGAEALADSGEIASRAYTREPDVEAQIRRLADVPRARLAVVALAGGKDSVKEETLVYLVRRYHADGDTENVSKLLAGLVRRINAKIARTITVWRLSSPASLADEVIDAVIMDFYDQVLTNEPSTQFWEVRFWVCLERRLLNIVREYARERDRIYDEVDSDDEGESNEDREPAALSWEDDPQMNLQIAEALAQLPDHWRTAFMLKNWAGHAIESDDGQDSDSIAAIMGISGRAVRYYLSRAEKRLAAWRIGINKAHREGAAND